MRTIFTILFFFLANVFFSSAQSPTFAELRDNKKCHLWSDRYDKLYLKIGEKVLGPFDEIARSHKNDEFRVRQKLSSATDTIRSNAQCICIDTNLTVKFIYPTDINYSYDFYAGVSETRIYTDTTTFFGMVDSAGNIVFEPKYKKCWRCGDGVVGAEISKMISNDGSAECYLLVFKTITNKSKIIETRLYDPMTFDLPFTAEVGDAVQDELIDCVVSEITLNLYISRQKLWVQRLFIQGAYCFFMADFDKAIEYFSAIKEENELYYELAQKNIEEINKIDRALLE